MSPWDMWKSGFDAWENATAQLVEQVLQRPSVLQPSGTVLSAVMKAKARIDGAAAQWWTLWGLPTKRDQERTLHLINQLQSKLFDLEEQLASQRGSELPAEAPVAPRSTARRAHSKEG